MTQPLAIDAKYNAFNEKVEAPVGGADASRSAPSDQVVTEIDEWDPSRGSFSQHAIAGSLAGVAEHAVMYPMDTVKTIMQARQLHGRHQLLAASEYSTPMSAAAKLWGAHGGARLWRGVQTMFTGCVPAHGAYFTIYESAKPAVGRLLASRSSHDVVAQPVVGSNAAAAGIAVALGTMAHDVIMTPMDVCKQRLQLGHHKNSVFDCACDILRKEGMRAFVLSYPTTLLMNLPYALVMGTTNETLREVLNPSGGHSVASFVVAGAGAGAVAAAATNPLDVIKTRLQTQSWGLAADVQTSPARVCPQNASLACPIKPLAYRGLVHAVSAIFAEEGARGFLRGMSARVCIHAPSVAICWTTYETVKHLLERLELV